MLAVTVLENLGKRNVRVNKMASSLLFLLLLLVGGVNGFHQQHVGRRPRPVLALASTDPTRLVDKFADYNAISEIEITASSDGLPRQTGALILEKEVTALIAFRSFG